MDDLVRILDYLHAQARHKCEVIGVSPFNLYLHLESSAPEDNVAIAGLSTDQVSDTVITRLSHFFEKRKRTPRIQFLDRLAPTLETALTAAGYTMDLKLPVLSCRPEWLCNVAGGPTLEITMVTDRSSDELLAEAWTLNALGFDSKAKAATLSDIQAFRPMLSGGRAFSAHLDGIGVGAGMFNALQMGVAELVGITTLLPYRRQGIATVLTSAITAAAFESGADLAFLVAASPEASRVYLRVGYQFRGHLVTFMKLPDDQDLPF